MARRVHPEGNVDLLHQGTVEVDLPRGQVELTETDDSAGVRSFYSRVGYGGGVQPADRLLVARLDQIIVAAVRLCAEGGALVLRGMYVAEDRRGQGIGAKLLDSLPAVIGSSDCWCIPYAHLTSFYSRIGFRVQEGKGIPSTLAERRGRYTAGGNNVVIMKRPKGICSSKSNK